MEKGFLSVFAVWETIDERGRRGELVGYYSTRAAADTRAEGRGWYGGKGDIESVTCLWYDNQLYALRNPPAPVVLDVDLSTREQVLRTSALAKLTAAERRVLGLEE